MFKFEILILLHGVQYITENKFQYKLQQNSKVQHYVKANHVIQRYIKHCLRYTWLLRDFWELALFPPSGDCCSYAGFSSLSVVMAKARIR
jgi:hypothetical protein